MGFTDHFAFFNAYFTNVFESHTRIHTDSGAAFLMHDNKPMIRALQKISNDYTNNDYKEIDKNSTRSAYLSF